MAPKKSGSKKNATTQGQQSRGKQGKQKESLEKASKPTSPARTSPRRQNNTMQVNVPYTGPDFGPNTNVVKVYKMPKQKCLRCNSVGHVVANCPEKTENYENYQVNAIQNKIKE